jgi:hypothetical protein
MDKLSHAILLADDTNIIGISTKYNDLHQRVDLTLQLILNCLKNGLYWIRMKHPQLTLHGLKLQLIP